MFETKRGPQRIDYNVAMRLLDALHEAGGEMKRSHLRNRSNTNQGIFNRYQRWLQQRSYIEVLNVDPCHQVVRITPEGTRALFKFRDIENGEGTDN